MEFSSVNLGMSDI